MPKEVDDKINAIKRSLREDHPDWSEDKIEETAWKIYNSQKGDD